MTLGDPVTFNRRLLFKQYEPLKPDKFGIRIPPEADADNTFYSLAWAKTEQMVSSSGEYVLGSKSFEQSVTLILPLTDMPLSESFPCSVCLTQSLESRDTYVGRTLKKNKELPS